MCMCIQHVVVGGLRTPPDGSLGTRVRARIFPASRHLGILDSFASARGPATLGPDSGTY